MSFGAASASGAKATLSGSGRRRVAVAVVLSACVGTGCATAYHGPLAPLCQGGARGNGEDCKETSDGYLVPPAYYETLQREEHTEGVPHASGETPVRENERQPATVAPAGFTAGPDGTPIEPQR